MRCTACDKLMRDNEVIDNVRPMCLHCRGKSNEVFSYFTDHEYVLGALTEADIIDQITKDPYLDI